MLLCRAPIYDVPDRFHDQIATIRLYSDSRGKDLRVRQHPHKSYRLALHTTRNGMRAAELDSFDTLLILYSFKAKSCLIDGMARS